MIDLTAFYILLGILFAELSILLYRTVTDWQSKKGNNNIDMVELVKIGIYLFFGYIMYDNIVNKSSADIIDDIFEPVVAFCILIIVLRLISSKHFRGVFKKG